MEIQMIVNGLLIHLIETTVERDAARAEISTLTARIEELEETTK